MYTVRIGSECVYTVANVKEAFELAIDYYKRDYECEVVNEVTGEVVLILKDGRLPYISSSICYTF